LNNTDGTPVLGPPVTGTINPHLYHNVKYNLLIHYCEIIKSFNRFHHFFFFFYINQRLHNPFNCFKHCILDKLIYIYRLLHLYIHIYPHNDQSELPKQSDINHVQVYDTHIPSRLLM
jgi:hypothetical protein